MVANMSRVSSDCDSDDCPVPNLALNNSSETAEERILAEQTKYKQVICELQSQLQKVTEKLTASNKQQKKYYAQLEE